MEREETRGAALVATPRRRNETKLPLLSLTARPGNVGVQIDAFRTMKMFNRPRCGKFTAQFQGISYENHSMENYSRVVERTRLRARIVGERLEKLKQHEANVIADEQRRRQRRREREATEQRHQWLLRQAAKKEEERAREETAASTIQRVARGHITRRQVEETKHHSAAARLQKLMRAFVHKRRSAKQHHEREKQQRLHAAKTIQRHARKRQASGRQLDALTADQLAAPLKIDSTTAESGNLTHDTDTAPHLEIAVATPSDLQELPAKPLLVVTATDVEELDLELLLSTPTVESRTPEPPQQPQPPVARPRRPVTIKRVGGGFRQSAAFQSPRLRTSRPPELAQAIAPRPPPPQPQQQYQARIAHPTRGTHRHSPQPSPRQSPRKSDTDADETALLELVEQLDLAVSALVDGAPSQPLEPQFLESGTTDSGT